MIPTQRVSTFGATPISAFPRAAVKTAVKTRRPAAPLPGTMNPQEFRQWANKTGRPHAKWEDYQGYVGNTRQRRQVNRAAVAATPAGASLVTGADTNSLLQRFLSSLQTPQQQAAQASAQVASNLKAQQADNAATVAAAQLKARNQAERAQGYMSAFANLTSPRAEEVAGQYREAADRIRSYGTGLTGQLGEDFQQAADQTAQHLAAEGVQTNGPVGSYNLPALQNTLQYTGAVMPGVTLEEQAANAGAQANFMRQANAGKIEDIAQQYLQKGTDLESELALKQQALNATRPELYQKAISAIRDAQDKNVQNLISNQLQQRALDVSTGTLQLSQAKSAQDRALAMTNAMGVLYVVDKKGNVVPTSLPAPGSTAGQVASANTRAAATITAQTARAAADRKVKQEINAANVAASRYATDTSYRGKIDAANVAAAAKKAAAQISAQAKKNAPPTPKQRDAVLNGARTAGNDLIEKRLNRISGLIPGLAKQGKTESNADYMKRHARAIQIYRGRLTEHRGEILQSITDLITPQLKILGYGPDQINGYANAVLNAYVPAGAGVAWLPPGLQGPVGTQ